MHADYDEPTAPNIYFDKNFDIEAVKISPGQYYVTARDMALVTVLGSCVAACIHDRESGVGGMNHFMLPDYEQDDANILNSPASHGVYAMEIMLKDLFRMGAQRGNLQAKVFGGGNVMCDITATTVGKANAAFVLDYLHRENIAVVAQDMLDSYPRKIYYFPRSGRVMVKQLHNLHNDTIIEREQAYRARLGKGNAET